MLYKPFKRVIISVILFFGSCIFFSLSNYPFFGWMSIILYIIAVYLGISSITINYKYIRQGVGNLDNNKRALIFSSFLIVIYIVVTIFFRRAILKIQG